MHPKKILVALPPGLLEQVDHVAVSEFRSRSDLIREALRDRIALFKKKEKEFPPASVPSNNNQGE